MENNIVIRNELIYFIVCRLNAFNVSRKQSALDYPIIVVSLG